MKILVPGIVIFGIWCMISVRWYVCGVYELCKDETEVSVAEQETSSTPDEDVLEQPLQAPLAFEWSDGDPLTNQDFNYYLDSLKEVFDKDPGAVVEITGLYDPQELNNTEFENLGLARAHNTKQLLLSSGLKRSIRVSSATDDLSAGLRSQINQAILFNLVPKEISTSGFIITEGQNKLVVHYPSKTANPTSNQQVQAALKKLVKLALKNNQDILVVGHTDNRGEAEKNNKLGLARASSVMDKLIDYGMPEKRVLAESEGEAHPLVSNATQRGRHQNRRVEITIIN